MLLILFSGGIKSDLYVFLFSWTGMCGIYGNLASSMNTGIACAILYAATCVISDKLYNEAFVFHACHTVHTVPVGRIAISRISFEVKRFDELRKKEFRLARGQTS